MEHIDNFKLISEVTIIALIAVLHGSVIFMLLTLPPLPTVTRYFIVNLAATDLLIGLVAVPLSLASHFDLARTFQMCLVIQTSISSLYQIKTLNVVALTVERAIAYKEHRWYSEKMTKVTAFRMIASVWAIGVLWTAIPLYGWNNKSQWEPDSHCQHSNVMDAMYMFILVHAVGYVIPMLVITFVCGHIYLNVLSKVVAEFKADCYSRLELKYIKGLAVIILLHAISFLPSNIISVDLVVDGSLWCGFCIHIEMIVSHAMSVFSSVCYMGFNDRVKGTLWTPQRTALARDDADLTREVLISRYVCPAADLSASPSIQSSAEEAMELSLRAVKSGTSGELVVEQDSAVTAGRPDSPSDSHKSHLEIPDGRMVQPPGGASVRADGHLEGAGATLVTESSSSGGGSSTNLVATKQDSICEEKTSKQIVMDVEKDTQDSQPDLQSSTSVSTVKSSAL